MAIDLFTFVGLFDRQLTTTAHLLDRGAAHLGAEAEKMLDWRLAEDMHPLRFQLKVVCNYTRSWPARVAGLEPPTEIGDDLDLAGFHAAIADARACLATFDRAQFDGRDDEPLTITLGDGMAPTLPVGRWLSDFAATNVHFHVSMVYAILRSRGVPLGKRDLFAGGL